jgi:hypothetical protein
MQSLMYDQPQPTCGRIENNGTERDGADHHAPQKDCLAKPPVWIGREQLSDSSSAKCHRPQCSLSWLRSRPFSTLPDGAMDLKHWNVGLTLVPIVAYNRCFEGDVGAMTNRIVGRRLAFGLFATGLFLLSAASAWAFSRENVSPDGGNYSFGDPDKQPTTSDNHSSSQGTRPFGSSGPVVQFGIQQGPASTFGQRDRYNTPDPYFRSLQNGN